MRPFKYRTPLNTGDFRHRINIQEPIGTEDDLGQTEITWQDKKKVWAMVKTTQGREYFAAAATQSENTVRFIIRYITGIDSTMRIIYKDKVYEIESIINDDELDKTLTIMAKG